MSQELYPFQDEGADFLAARTRALLADTMGLGKTAQAIVAADRVGAQRILVVCPASVRINWRREFARFSTFDRNVSVISTGLNGPCKDGITIVSYELATSSNTWRALMALQYDAIILDESHFLKTRDTKRTEAVLGRQCKGQNCLIERGEHVWALTGTPTPNHPGEIFSILRAFGVWTQSYYAFEEKFCEVKHGDYGPIITGMKNVAELKQLVKPIMIRRKVEEVMTDLPSITFSDIALEAKGISHPDDIKEWKSAERGDDGKLLKTRLQAAADDANVDLSGLALPTLRRVTGMAKVRPVCELIMRELDSGLDKIVIFAVHRDVIEVTRQTLQRYGAVTLYGGNSAETKQKRIDDFVNKWKPRVFIGQIQAAGVGIDGLQKVCNNILFIEASWTPSDNLQAIGRIRRHGQTRPVLCRFASLADSLDEHLMRVNRHKTQMISQLLD